MVTRNPDNDTSRRLSAEAAAELIAERFHRETREGRPAEAALVQRIAREVLSDALPTLIVTGVRNGDRS